MKKNNHKAKEEVGWLGLAENVSSPLTEESLVILRFSFEQAINPLDWAKLHLHVCQVPHHPVHVVGHLIQEDRKDGYSHVVPPVWTHHRAERDDD